MLRQLLTDDEWIDGFLEENRRRLRASYAAVTKVLDAYRVVHVPAEAGLFFLIDVRPMMRDLSWESEDEVWRTVIDDHGST